MAPSQNNTVYDANRHELAGSGERDEEFNFMDGNIFLKVRDHVFFVHKFKLVKFRKIEEMVLSREEILLEGSVEDFRNVLRILYASFEKLDCFRVDTRVLKSALRIATQYDYLQLREFAIRQLDAQNLTILDYLTLGCKFDVVDWETRALDHLVSREEPITEAEAEIIGIKSFVATAARREERLSQRKASFGPLGRKIDESTQHVTPAKRRRSGGNTNPFICRGGDSGIEKVNHLLRVAAQRLTPNERRALGMQIDRTGGRALRYTKRCSVTLSHLSVPSPPTSNLPTLTRHRVQMVHEIVQASENKLEDVTIHCTTFTSVTPDKEFNFPDGSVNLLVNAKTERRQFHVHKYKLEEFSTIKAMMSDEEYSSAGLVVLDGDPDDFHHMFKVLYAPSYMPTPHVFGAETLKSTLRIAHNLGHQSLESFAIRQLEALVLSPIDYFTMARDIGVPRWEERAIDKLINRDEPLTPEEACALGVDALMSVVSQRESILRQRAATIFSPGEYSALPATEQAKANDQLQILLSSMETPPKGWKCDTSTEPVVHPRPPVRASEPLTGDLLTPSRRRFTARVVSAGNAKGILGVQKTGNTHRKTGRTLRSALSPERAVTS
ncbi:hypothetical protein FRC09_002541 [Ceratobasidium sp. 395]|nr:hypothetical protein FRC09_002541 [Ceratobasidium sp. 395]